MVNKEDWREILCKSNLEDLIIFVEISMGGRYSIIMNMKSNQDLTDVMLGNIRKRVDLEYQ